MRLKTVLIVGAAGILAYWLLKNKVSSYNGTTYTDDLYHSVDNGTGTETLVKTPEGYVPIKANYPVFTGGTYIQPRYLGPLHNYQIQRLV